MAILQVNDISEFFYYARPSPSFLIERSFFFVTSHFFLHVTWIFTCVIIATSCALFDGNFQQRKAKSLFKKEKILISSCFFSCFCYFTLFSFYFIWLSRKFNQIKMKFLKRLQYVSLSLQIISYKTKLVVLY